MKQQKGSSNHPLDPRIHLPSDPWDTPRLHPKDRKRWARGARSIFRPLDHRQITTHINEGDLQDPTDGGMLVPYFWPYELWGYSLKFRPKN